MLGIPRRVAAMQAGQHTARAMPASRPDDPSDESLMLTYARGSAAAFDALYARYKSGVYRYLFRHCGNAGTADELFQDVWMNVIRTRATYAPTARFATWLYTLAHHRIVDHWRANVRTAISTEADAEAGDAVAALPGARSEEPEIRAGNREIAARLWAALSSLSPVQRDAFLLQQESGLSLGEIATLTGVGVETVKSRLRYAIAKLRGELHELREGTSDEC